MSLFDYYWLMLREETQPGFGGSAQLDPKSVLHPRDCKEHILTTLERASPLFKPLPSLA